MTDEALALIRKWRTSLAGAAQDRVLEALREAVVMSDEADYPGSVGAVRGFVEACLPESIQAEVRRSMGVEVASIAPYPPMPPPASLRAARAEIAQLRSRREARAAKDTATGVSVGTKARLVARCELLKAELVELAGKLGVPVEALDIARSKEGPDVGRIDR